MGARYGAESWAEHAESLETRRRPGFPSLSLYISKRVPLYMYLTVGSRACVCAMCVYRVCACVGPPATGAGRVCVRPGGAGRCLSPDFLPLKPLLYFPEGCHFGGVGNKSRTLKVVSPVRL
ncbi:unnamed protein product [Rangifer tarandus platyrhynchus]|uniref:Uncharacterized protein n=2 Tax=Rangifer tarandus platyrhynchus TaxID=3082113 RepID=A0ABN8ZBE6_RANTA|nr:unnamed protein product [Rangifer tarandus platyrhynchus]